MARAWEGPPRIGAVVYQRSVVLLSETVYDLSASIKHIARLNGARAIESLSAAFSRAVRGLIEREYLEAPTLIPVQTIQGEKYSQEWRFHHLDDGVYLSAARQKIRFVRKGKRYANSLNAYGKSDAVCECQDNYEAKLKLGSEPPSQCSASRSVTDAQ